MTPATNNALDALSAEDGSAVALAVSQAASENTRRAYRQQWAAFTTWASAKGYPYLPALDATLAALPNPAGGPGLRVSECAPGAGRGGQGAPARRFSPPPPVRLRLRPLLGIGRSIGAAQGQAAALTAEGLAAIRATAHLPRRGRGGCPETAGFARQRGLVGRCACQRYPGTACCASPKRWPWPGPTYLLHRTAPALPPSGAQRLTRNPRARRCTWAKRQ